MSRPTGGVGLPFGNRGFGRPQGRLGQLINFAVVYDRDEHYSRYILYHTRPGDTIAAIVARRGQPEMGHEVAKLNHIRHLYRELRPHTRLRLPGIMKQTDVVSVLADDPPPLVKDGYAIFDTVDVPGRKGITRFKGYNPYAMDVPIQWEQYIHKRKVGAGVDTEADIVRLERMAGRGDYPGGGIGPPAAIRVSVTDNYGHVVPLVPRNFQWMKGSNSPLYRIAGLVWDPNPLRGDPGTDAHGRRLRQKAVVSLQEHTPFRVVERSVSRRSRQRHTKTRG